MLWDVFPGANQQKNVWDKQEEVGEPAQANPDDPENNGGGDGEGARGSKVEAPEDEDDEDEEGGEGADVDEDDEEEEEDEEQAALLAKVKKMYIWEFHGVMYLALMEVRANSHIKGGGEGEGKG